MSKEDGVRIDIKGLVSSIRGMVPCDVPMMPHCCIFKIPITLSRHNKKAFVPDAFSIGPLHRRNKKLEATEKIKVKYLHDLISRSGSRDTMLETLVSSVARVEKQAREYYAEPITYDPKELVKILVIDGCFLIELLCKSHDNVTLKIENDPIFSRSCMIHFIYHDLILLENQVPWMVLELLFEKIKDSGVCDMPCLVSLATEFMSTILLAHRIDPQSDQCIEMEDIKHFVDLLRKLSTLRSTDPKPDQCTIIRCIKPLVDTLRKLAALSSTPFRKLAALSSTPFRKLAALSSTPFRKLAALSSTPFRKLAALSKSSSGEEKKERLRERELVPSATTLVEAGIKFKRATSRSLLDVKFEDGVLEISPLKVHDLTETIFRNAISYEQCYHNCQHKITSYAVLLDSLINTAKDIDILCKYEIIENWLNPEDAAQLFNKLYHDTSVSTSMKNLVGKYLVFANAGCLDGVQCLWASILTLHGLVFRHWPLLSC
jgi:hypothetical protein